MSLKRKGICSLTLHGKKFDFKPLDETEAKKKKDMNYWVSDRNIPEGEEMDKEKM